MDGPDDPDRDGRSADVLQPLASLPVMIGGGGAVLLLYFGRDVLEPLALAILFSLALTPVVRRLERWRVPRVVSVLGVAAMAFLVVAGFASVVASQVFDLAHQLPRYEHNLLSKIDALREAAPKGGLVRQIMRMGDDLHRAVVQGLFPPPPPSGEAPIPVEIHQRISPWRLLETVAGPALRPLAEAAIVVVFTIFILMQREDLRDRLIRLAGPGDLRRATTVIDDAVGRLSRYLLAQLSVNTAFGTLIGSGLWVMGLPNPLLWGMMGGVLRFIPYVGSTLAVTFPVLLSIAVAPGWTMPILVLALFLSLELVVANFVEPLFYGSSTGLSPLSVLAAAIVWTTLWGPVGLLLSTPLTVCLMVLGRHVPMLHFLTVILGDAPVLPPEARLYQRMLAGDRDEVLRICEQAGRGVGPGEVYDRLVLPALGLAERDRRNEALPRDRRRAIVAMVDAVVEAFALTFPPSPPPSAETAAVLDGRPLALCARFQSDLDGAAALLLADLLRRGGIRVRLGEEPVDEQDHNDVSLVCYCAMTFDPHHARRLARRAAARFGHVQLIFLVRDDGGRLIPAGLSVVRSLRDAVAAIGSPIAEAVGFPADVTE